MIFPTLIGKPFGYVNLDLLAREVEGHDQSSLSSFLNPDLCNTMLRAQHFKRGIAWSYGGLLEDRSTVWRGSYLEPEQKFVHLGIDFNAPEGTPIAADMPLTVFQVDTDHPTVGGWGTRVLAYTQLRDVSYVMLFAHLHRSLSLKRSDVIRKGETFARVGEMANNGQWYPHVHVQVMTADAYHYFEQNPDELDGYGKAADLHALARMFPDPLQFVNLK